MNEARGAKKRLEPDENQVGRRSASALCDELRPQCVLAELRAALDAMLGAPLALPLEELTLVTKPRFDGEVGRTLAIVRHEDNLSAWRSGYCGSEADELIA